MPFFFDWCRPTICQDARAAFLFVEITISCYISCVNTFYIKVYIKII
nr:MAG TPA: hypothetical protein [Bacteriophage sp.]